MNRGASWDTIRSSSALVEHKFETGQTFSYVQTGATTALNVGSCWPTMCRPFTRGFRHKTIQTKAP